LQVTGAWPRGNEGQHLKLRLIGADGSGPFDAIAFRFGHLARYFEQPRWIDIVYTLEADEWNGSPSLQLNIKDFRSAR
jgi:single-stranded-DNA-specific exonuclease